MGRRGMEEKSVEGVEEGLEGLEEEEDVILEGC